MITPELKVEAKIDEHYVERVMPGLPASFEREGKKYDMEVTKVYPEVREGQFRTDLHFVSGRPENIRAGQTYHLNLQLGALSVSAVRTRSITRLWKGCNRERR